MALEEGVEGREEDQTDQAAGTSPHSLGGTSEVDAGGAEEEFVGKQRDAGGGRPQHDQSPIRFQLPQALQLHGEAHYGRRRSEDGRSYYWGDPRFLSEGQGHPVEQARIHGRVLCLQQRGARLWSVGRRRTDQPRAGQAGEAVDAVFGYSGGWTGSYANLETRKCG